MKTEHQKRVDLFMIQAGQEVPVCLRTLSKEVRHLRAKLILEEALETIRAGLGVRVMLNNGIEALGKGELTFEKCEFYMEQSYDLVELVDGCCDIKVVTTGTLSALGLPDEDFQEIVDRWNLAKFGPGSYKRADGKYMKPPNFEGPNNEIQQKIKEYET